MKSFKIVNSFVFLFVINLSITFLDKNNLFATFINGVLQTENNNLYQRKQRNLAESENLSVKDDKNYSGFTPDIYIDKLCGVDMFAFKDMIADILRSPAGSKYATAYDQVLFNHKYASRAGFEGIYQIEKYPAFSRYLTYIKLFSSLDNINLNLSNVFEKLKEINSIAKKIVNIYIEGSDKNLKEEILTIGFVKNFISSNYTPRTPEHEIDPDCVYKLVEVIIFGLKLEGLIS